MKKNIDYYPHKSESHRHPKFRMLRSMFSTIAEGWAAEGRFWALNNLIAQSEDCQLNLTKKRNKGVFADELGMSIQEFEEFISILTSEDVELLTQIETDIYTTDTVQETYSSIAGERERARKNKTKPVNISSYEEKPKSYTELSESYTELNNKGNKKKENERELNKKKEEEAKTTFFNSHFETIKTLYARHSKINDPVEKTQILPVAKFYKHIPEHLTEKDISEAIEAAFKALDKTKGVKVEYLCSNIQAKISAKWEEKLDKLKENERKEAEKHRKDREKAQKETEWEDKTKIISRYKTFYEKHSLEFTSREQKEILRLLNERKVMQLGSIIEPKIEELELKLSD